MAELLVVAVPLLAAVAGWFLRGRFTPARRSERYDLANKILEVRGKLVALGWEDDQIEKFITTLESDRTGERASSALRVIGPHAAPAPEGSSRTSILDTTAAMGARTAARLNVLDAEIEQVLLDIEILAGQQFQQSGREPSHYDPDHVRKMQRAWKLYRTRAARSAAEDYAGGTIGHIIWSVEEVRLAESFLKDMRARLEELKQ